MSETLVYFAQRGHRGPIKIGKSRNVPERITYLSTGIAEKLNVLATYRGGAQTEKYLHQKLAQHRLNGEWFRPHREVLDVVHSVIAGTFKPGSYRPVTRDESRHERVVEFLGRTFCNALRVAYGSEPGWARQAAADAGCGAEAVKYWARGHRIPHTHNMLNIAKNNEVMGLWLYTAGVATWLAREVGCGEDEAYAVALNDFDRVRRAWNDRGDDGVGPILREMWNDREAKAEEARRRADEQIWVF